MKTRSHEPHFSRRTLFKAAAGFGGSTLLGGLPFRAFAQTAAKAAQRYFVFAYFQGGWDQLLALDPRDPTVFTADQIPSTHIFPGYSLIADPTFPQTPVVPPTRLGAAPSNIAFGPAIGNLANHYDLMAVVRGINMATLSHDVGYRYFLTGKRPAGDAARGSSTATEIVGQEIVTQVALPPIPSVAYGIETYNDRYSGAANALSVSRVQDLLFTLSPSPIALDSEIEKQLLDFQGRPVTCEAQLYDSRGLVTQYRQSQRQVEGILAKRLDNAFRFEQPQNAALRASYGLSPNPPYDTPNGRAALVATAIKQGISQCVTLSVTSGLDTHFGTQTLHATNLRLGFNALANLVQDLRTSPHPAGGTFIDRTTILVFSEFARTPLMNPTNGRDHHLCSSCLLLGAGIKHNMVFGLSGDIGMSPGTLDLTTGQPNPSGDNISPENVIATVLASANLDYSILRVGPLTPLLA